ncbi:MAG: DegT/DnrJ/EryC1/StrS family aminotransferase [Clostridiales Family XIII bacterium]|jgi:perosamine synthetase|nr:DegT/DnrJ/EryC1/StrS family aminotransferase [Clostridiales Family XIII bacterium]
MIPIARPQISQAEKDAVMAVLDSGMIACGQTVTEFETSFAEYVGAACGVATTSGTTALEVALRALGIGVGDKVITTAWSFIASTNSILYTGAVPVFADIDSRTFDIDPDRIEDALKANPDAKAIQVVHLFGQPCDMDRIVELALKYNVRLIEDCAQAHGAEWRGRKVGSFGDAAAFSFYPTKNMTTGEGGIVLLNDEKVEQKARLLINHGMERRYIHDEIGYNYRMTNIAAAIGLEQLKRLDGFNNARRNNAALYDKGIANPLVETPFVLPGAKHIYHQYTIKVLDGKRDDLIALFEQNGIGYGIFYPYSIPEQPAYSGMGFRADWPATDLVKTQALSIPVHPGVTEDDVKTVTDVINSLPGNL